MYWITGILGLAMVVAPFASGYGDSTNAMQAGIVLGLIVLLASAYEWYDSKKGQWEYWVAGAAGILAIIAPFALGFSSVATAMWTTLILGVLVLLTAGYKVFYMQPPRLRS